MANANNFLISEDELELKPRELLLELLERDDVIAVEKILKDGIRDVDPQSKTATLVNERTIIGGWFNGNMLHTAVNIGAFKCAQLLISAPYSWNVDLPAEEEGIPINMAGTCRTLEMINILAPSSTQMKPYPAEFTFFTDVRDICNISEYMFWPQLLLHHQPERMRSHVEEAIQGTIYTTTEGQQRIRINFEPHILIHWYALVLELLLANAELGNFDLSCDNRLEYESIVQIDSSRMWPIKPMEQKRIEGHMSCTSYPKCITDSGSSDTWGRDLWRQMFDFWTFHRFGHIARNDKGDTVSHVVWNPPSLREFSRLVIRRCMVRHVAPLNGHSDEHLFPNQAVLLRYINMPDHLREYMLFTDIPIRSY